MAKNGSTTKKRILEETQNLVYETGFAAATIDKIIERCGITKGTFFYHFKSKADLAQSLIYEFTEKDIEELQKALCDTEIYQADPFKRMLEFVQWYINLMSDKNEPVQGCLYALYSYQPGLFDTEIQEHISSAILNWRNLFGELLDDVLKVRKPKITIDKVSLQDMFVAIFEGGFILEKILEDPQATSKQLQNFKNYLELIFDYENKTGNKT